MAFQGSLSELPLPDILQLVSVSGKTGSFTIENGSESGRIFLSEGQIVHAESGRLSGEEAIYELAIWTSGEFVFEPGEVSAPASIHKSNTTLLMEAARRIDEWRLLAKRVPSTALVPVFNENGGATTVSLSPQEWAVVRNIDERRTIEEIAESLDTSPFEVAKVVYGLIANGLVELAEDPRRLDLGKLTELSGEALRGVAREVRELAVNLLGEHSRSPEVRAELDQRLDALGREPDAPEVGQLVREAERFVSSALGPHRAETFVQTVEELLGDRAGAE